MKRAISSWEYTCDRCGYVDSNNEGWLCRTGVDLCPGCEFDLLRFLSNVKVRPMGQGHEYRTPDPQDRDRLRESLEARGVSPYGNGRVPGDSK